MTRTGIMSQIERIIEVVLDHRTPLAAVPASIRRLIDEIHRLDTAGVRVVVFGGGTGLSTVVGGNAQRDDWHDMPDVGLKAVFPKLDVVVCTTDDGGSTGEMLKYLPMIGIGDIRKLCLSMILPQNLAAQYGLRTVECGRLAHLVQTIFNHRFSGSADDARVLLNPLLAAPATLRSSCPAALRDLLRDLGTYMVAGAKGPVVPLPGHCLGNVLLAASVFMENGVFGNQPPSMNALRRGIDRVASALGVQPGRLHPATATPGQLVFHYTNGIAVRGQSKALRARRGFPVSRIETEFAAAPEIAADVLAAVRNADVIILAPGSLYTSSIPVLQVPGIADAIRANRSALKILGANLWIEEGETDITHADKRRGFRVSELCEAYDRNVPGGSEGLFQFVLSANLENMPATILRNYALEGKRPLYLDRDRVTARRVYPVEATIFSREHARTSGVVQHDPGQFAVAVRTLLFAWRRMRSCRSLPAADAHRTKPQVSVHAATMPLCRYWQTMRGIVAQKSFQPASLKGVLLDMLWANRDIQPGHLAFFSGVRAVAARSWQRSDAWDNVLGYYEPAERTILIHRRLLDDPERLRGTMLIALGESLLGNYIAQRDWIVPSVQRAWGIRRYEIRLRSPAQRKCFLNPQQLDTYLRLARMARHPARKHVYGITLNNSDGFLPPGLLFGLMFAWYLDNTAAPIMENEMALLHLQEETLIPHQAQEYRRKKALITFFRREVFGYGD